MGLHNYQHALFALEKATEVHKMKGAGNRGEELS